MFPQATIIALLVDPTNPSAETLSRDVQAAAHTLGLRFMSCVPAPNPISIRSLQTWPKGEQERS
jgi:hypothetical protein